MSVAVTNGIRVAVATRYLPDHSQPEAEKFVFAYDITISNESDEQAQLLARHWIIQDATNFVDEVIGEGVVGKTPILRPGGTFFYTSFCPLRTEWGVMKGTYNMVRPDGAEFEVVIAPFALLPPHLLN
jgi:ApaG protein